ncbi:MAG: DUF4468 domain-containing protein [Bdellovibrionales bacterium]|nr:DUF4468 domain-containing protein [Bdellovibrionales bacterium]
MKKLVLLLTLSGCAAMSLKAVDQKDLIHSYVIENKKSKSENYQSALVFFSKNLVDSNQAIKMQDKESGRIITRMIHVCDDLLRPDVVNITTGKIPTEIQYNIETLVKDKKVKLNLEMTGVNAQTLGGNMQRPIAQAKGQEQAIKKCSDKLKNFILEGLAKDTETF